MKTTRQNIIDILFQLASTPAMVLNVNEAADKLLVVFESHCYNRLKLITRSEQIDLLDKYTRFLQKNSYIDSDATCEEPYAIDEFLKEINQSHEKPQATNRRCQRASIQINTGHIRTYCDRRNNVYL